MLRCSVCRRASRKTSFATQRCTGSAAARWAKHAEMVAASGLRQGYGHSRLISGDVIWCEICGCYSDTATRGLAQPCPGPPAANPTRSKGGRKQSKLHWGRARQLKLLRCRLHPNGSGVTLPRAVRETNWQTSSLAAHARVDMGMRAARRAGLRLQRLRAARSVSLTATSSAVDASEWRSRAKRKKLQSELLCSDTGMAAKHPRVNTASATTATVQPIDASEFTSDNATANAAVDAPADASCDAIASTSSSSSGSAPVYTSQLTGPYEATARQVCNKRRRLREDQPIPSDARAPTLRGTKRPWEEASLAECTSPAGVDTLTLDLGYSDDTLQCSHQGASVSSQSSDNFPLASIEPAVSSHLTSYNPEAVNSHSLSNDGATATRRCNRQRLRQVPAAAVANATPDVVITPPLEGSDANCDQLQCSQSLTHSSSISNEPDALQCSHRLSVTAERNVPQCHLQRMREEKTNEVSDCAHLSATACSATVDAPSIKRCGRTGCEVMPKHARSVSPILVKLRDDKSVFLPKALPRRDEPQRNFSPVGADTSLAFPRRVKRQHSYQPVQEGTPPVSSNSASPAAIASRKTVQCHHPRETVDAASSHLAAGDSLAAVDNSRTATAISNELLHGSQSSKNSLPSDDSILERSILLVSAIEAQPVTDAKQRLNALRDRIRARERLSRVPASDAPT